MGLTATDDRAAIVWHDIECGGYRADLPLWHELALQGAALGGPVLDVGAGTGRVALALARAGHAVVALDSDPLLLDALARRGRGLPVRCVCCEARELGAQLAGPHSLCIVAMQTIQLLGGPAERGRFLGPLRALMAPGALLACAIAPRVEPFDVARGSLPPLADRLVQGDTLYLSQPTVARHTERGIVLQRRREIADAGGARRTEDITIVLYNLTRKQLQREAAASGWVAQPAREIPATDDYVGATVVMLRA